ncbi:Branched-chain amino acid transport protein [Geosporobacter subterraneus DSM 17957]|uniref:Branched-chain amino acid transport protein n=1 Tax=Geosporobacter subterraneus DSM 17957 TaxID=1121919 RepID=A0A1M6GEE6_9FIRM|nr:AzlD domain-containing protein [Geosporobacter subterraneus]SHJ08304.1 Branched-chain amino acid transport protein [Geosporobacter subterraneus DSM 17957]
MKQLVLLILGMGFVTYSSRMLSMVLLQEVSLHPFLQRFLRFIPYAALGALIFPGVLTSTSSLSSAAAGGLVAAGLAYFRFNLIIVVFGSISTVFLWQLLMQ